MNKMKSPLMIDLLLESFIVDLRSESEEDDSNDYIDIDDNSIENEMHTCTRLD